MSKKRPLVFGMIEMMEKEELGFNEEKRHKKRCYVKGCKAKGRIYTIGTMGATVRLCDKHHTQLTMPADLFPRPVQCRCYNQPMKGD